MPTSKLLGFFTLCSLIYMQSPLALDNIPENLSDWTEHGTVFQTSSGITWESKNQLAVAGVEKVGDTYYLFYLAGFDGCWDNDGDSNHQSLGLATSTDGINFTKYPGNPILKPHDFVAVGSVEEGIRTAYVRYLPSKGKFYAYLGVESPGGADECSFGGTGNCECDTGVDAALYLATSSNGINWTLDGEVSGAYFRDGHEVYASGWVFDGTSFFIYVTTAQGGQNKALSTGQDPLNLTEAGGVPALSFGWSGVDTYLHDDNNTVTLMYEPDGGSGHPGVNNDNLYFATTYLNNPTVIENERTITTSGDERNIIFKDGDLWRWYYSDEADEYNNNIKLRTHPIGDADTLAPSAPSNLN